MGSRYIKRSNKMGLKNNLFTYISLLYWIIQGISLLSVGGFGSFPIVVSIILFILCGLRLFIKNYGYRVTFALLLFLYSLIFCFMALPASVFIYNTIVKTLIYVITIINLIISILMLRDLRKEIKEY